MKHSTAFDTFLRAYDTIVASSHLLIPEKVAAIEVLTDEYLSFARLPHHAEIARRLATNPWRKRR